MAVAGCALLAVPLFAFARPDDDKSDDKDKAQARKELKDLEEQRAKLDSRIRDLRKKAGLPGGRAFVWEDGKAFAFPGGEGEHSIVIEKALGDAHKAVEEAMKNMPKHFENFNFNWDDKDGKAFKLWVDKDGKSHKWDSQMSDEDKKKFKLEMEKMQSELRENLKGLKDLKIDVPEIHAFSDDKDGSVRIITPRTNVRPRIVTPEYRIVEPRVRGGGDDSRELRDEIRSLRDEVEKLRDEVKRGRGKSTNPDRFEETNLL
jgi:DNA repair exonuclease SbcCD ATPase subunit